MPTQPIEVVGDGYEVIIRDGATLARKSLPPQMIGAADWTIERFGGCNYSTLPLATKSTGLSHITVGDRVEIWYGGDRQYRGWIRDRTPTQGEPDGLSLKAYGLLFDMGRKYSEMLFVEAGGGDIRQYFETLAEKYVLSILPDVVIEVPEDPTGFTLTRFDTRGKSLQAAFNELCEASAGEFVWGFDVDPDSKDRLYLRAIGAGRDGVTGLRVISVPGAGVTNATGQINASDIINRLRLTGGELQFPNLVPNASFESPTEPNANSTNYLANGSFEYGTGGSEEQDAVGWTMVGGARVVKRGTGDRPSPLTGDWHLETDEVGEYGEQERVIADGQIVAGQTYRLQVNARPETTWLFALGEVKLSWDTGSGWDDAVPVGGTVSEWQVAPSVGAYAPFSKNYVAPSGVIGVRVQLAYLYPGEEIGIYWDDISLFDGTQTAQEGWRYDADPEATGIVDWNDTESPFHGGYAVTAVVSAADRDDSGTGPSVRIRLADRIAVTPGITYMLAAWLQAYSRDGESDFVQIAMIGQLYKSDGSKYGDPLKVVSGVTTGWQNFGAKIFTPDRDAATIDIVFDIWTPGVYRLDAITLTDLQGQKTDTGLFTPGTDTDHPYLPDGPLSLLLKAEEVFTEEENEAVYNSFSTYGWREYPESVDTIVTISRAVEFARAYFPSRAVEIRQPTVTIAGARQKIWVSDSVRLEGEDGPALGGSVALPVGRIKGGAPGGVLSRVLELGKEQPTLAGLIRKAAKEAKTR